MPDLKNTLPGNTQPAQRLADLLDNRGEQGDVPLPLLEHEEQELQELLAVADWITQTTKAEPSAQFRQQSRQRILKQINQPKPVTFWQGLRLIFTEGLSSFKIKRRTALVLMSIILLVAMLSVGGTNIVLASSDALPGDSLYNIKILIEQAQLVVASPEQRVEQINGNLETRVEEIEALVEAGRFEDLQVALATFDSEVSDLANAMASLPPQSPERSEAHQLLLETAHNNRIQVLTSLLDKVPESARPAIEKAIQSTSDLEPQETKGKPEKTVTPQPTKEKPAGKPEDINTPEKGKPTTLSTPEKRSNPTATPKPTHTPKPTKVPPGQVDKDKPEKPDKPDKPEKKEK